MDDSSGPKSATSFSPGPHRRSHPSLKHLSLVPLTPKYPIYPSDYDAYVDPETSRLHTSSSLSHMASIPGSGSVLSDGSRRPALQPHRKAKSSASMAAQRPSYSSRSTGDSEKGKSKEMPVDEQREKSKRTPHKTDPAWLFQTGIVLAEGSRESKGQSWLAKRDSSTSLHSSSDDMPNFGGPSAAKPIEKMPPRSRSGTIKARQRSKRDLQMTPTHKPANLGLKGRADTDSSTPRASKKQEEDGDSAEPDWADLQTQAEIAASIDSEMSHELDCDAFGLAIAEDDDSDEGGSTDEEKELTSVANSGGFRLGGLLDNVANVFSGIGDNEEDDLERQGQRNEETNVTPTEGNVTPRVPERIVAFPETDRKEASERSWSDDGMEPAPETPVSAWEDVRWLGRLIYNTATS